jgi:3-oxoacyl-[acyl-carrier-protein] synthase III
MSSFIQQKIGANESFNGHTSTFSFDLTNGGCGMLTGMMVADGFLLTGLTAYGMVVAGDAEPVPGLSDGYGFTPAAAAVLLTPGGEDEGFVAFQTETDTNFLSSCHGRMEWTGERKKQNWLVLRSGPAYAEEGAAFAACLLERFLGELALAPEAIDLLLPSQSPPGFAAALKRITGWGDKVVDTENKYGHVHTAGLGMALEAAVADGRFATSRNCIFLTVGAGITVSLALYRNR